MMTSTSDQGHADGELISRLGEMARDNGFADLGVSDLSATSSLEPRLQHFLAEGRHGDMVWMENRSHWRQDPSVLWPEMRSVIMLTTDYGPDYNPLDHLADRSRGLVSAYAARRDYHDVVKKRLKVLARWLVQETGCALKVFVDTAPVMEKPLAAAAGLGWQGKHTNLVSRSAGSWTFLGAIFTDLTFPMDQPGRDNCGRCQACIDICPTRAIIAPYQLDARRCIAYLTVEHQGQIPVEFRAAIGNRIFGCDDCLAICPWNKFARTSRDEKLQQRAGLVSLDLGELLQLDDASFRQMFAQTPVKRLGRARFVRNVLVAAGNSANAELTPLVIDLLRDDASLVRGMAVWALAQLMPSVELQKLADDCLAGEGDEGVQAEWRSALA